MWFNNEENIDYEGEGESLHQRFSRRHSDNESRNHQLYNSQNWNRNTQSTGNYYRGNRNNHQPNYNYRPNRQNFNSFSRMRNSNGQQNYGGQSFQPRNQGYTNSIRNSDCENVDSEEGPFYRAKYQEYLKFRRCQSSMDLRDMNESNFQRKNFPNQRMGNSRRSVDREIMGRFNNRKSMERESDAWKRPNNGLLSRRINVSLDLFNSSEFDDDRKNSDNELDRSVKGLEESSTSHLMGLKRKLDQAQEKKSDLVIKIPGTGEVPGKREVNEEKRDWPGEKETNEEDLSIISFTSDSSGNGNKEAPRKKSLQTLSSREKSTPEKMRKRSLSKPELLKEQNSKKGKLPDSFEWGDDSDGDFDDNDNIGQKFLYTADTLPKYDGKIPVGQEGGVLIQVHCCTYCKVVYKNNKLLQHHFLTRSHYNKYKALLNDTEVMQMFKKC